MSGRVILRFPVSSRSIKSEPCYSLSDFTQERLLFGFQYLLCLLAQPPVHPTNPWSLLPVSRCDDHLGRGPKDVFVVGQEVGDLVAGGLGGFVRGCNVPLQALVITSDVDWDKLK